MSQTLPATRPVPGTRGRVLYLVAVLAILLVFLFPLQRWFAQAGGRWLYILLFSFLLAFLLVRPVRALAWTYGILDVPDSRKLHGKPTPLLGGVAVYLAFLVSLLANSILSPAVIGLLVAATGVMLVSLVDDVRPLPAGLKLAVLVLATLVVVYSGISLTLFPARTFWGQALNLLLTIVWVVGITSAMNFFDGMDGLAAGLAAITAGFLGIIAYQSHQVFLGWISAALLGSSLGFLPYNFRPGRRATIFLGDAGSNFLGFTLASLAVLGAWAENSLVDLAAPVLIFGVFTYDMVYITADRVVSGKVRCVRDWIEYVGRDHLHHRLAAVLGRPEDAVLFIYAMSVALGVGATVLLMASPLSAVLLLGQTVVILLMVTILERRGRRAP
ncbi:MAG: undecaprenyl/decaprenyl-phosphate alpha-N-acetylglucosaminyl 1-phosphate transferase [Candidatus Rokubacteria bacterium]|nr:undecaprenyl/decaprenyl-phosphate alpha-N-acetylglucosaminyl 1-phosphate transferase [Candidatus Rokubacteria bacterium]